MAPCITGVGYLSHSRELCAPVEANAHYTAIPVTLEAYPLFYESGTYWAFAIHYACLRLLALRVSGAEHCTLNIATHLMSILLSTKINSWGQFLPGHDYGGAAELQSSWENPIANSSHARQSFIHADPLDLSILTSLTIHQDEVAQVHQDFSHVPIGKDIFASLPTETIHQIAISLSTEDLTRLRLSSRAVSQVTSRKLLPQSFWHSRFGPSLEMGFASRIYCDSHERVDWRDEYLRIKTAVNTSEGFESLKNRRRIWTILGEISRDIELLIAQNGLEGNCFPRLEYNAESCDDSLLHYAQFGRVAGAETTVEWHKPLTKGCRCLASKVLNFPNLPRSGEHYVGISGSHIFGRSYICGLRISNIPLSSQSNHTRLGLIDRRNETLQRFPSGTVLKGIEIATTMEGIVGMKMLVDCATDRIAPSWIGSFAFGEPDVAFTRLLAAPGRYVAGFVAEFDVSLHTSLTHSAMLIESFYYATTEYTDRSLQVCRMTSLRLLEEPDSYLPHSDSISLSLLSPYDITDTHLWTPRIPRLAHPVELLPSDVADSPRIYRPLLNIEFGGHDGDLLPSLQSISASLGDVAFVGLTFTYSNGASTLYGRKGQAVKTVYIDGPGGEGISKVFVEHPSTVDLGILSLKVW